MKKILLSFVLILSAMGVWANNITFNPLQYESLPNMGTPRRSHVCFATTNGDIVVVGGHTTGFELTTTAERLHNGVWESVAISHPHDGASYITLPDGRVLICGGFSSGWGVGQSKWCEIYDPATNSFTTTGSLNVARGFSSAVCTGVGNNVLVSGNWYADDTKFELWNGESWTSFGQKTIQMNHPFMVSDGQGIVYVFGSRDNYASLVPITVWKVNTNDLTVETISNTGLEEYDELFNGENFSFQTADNNIFLLGKKDNVFHLLSFSAVTGKSTDLTTLPEAIPDVTYHIDYVPGILVNEGRKEAYIMGYYEKSLVLVNYNLGTSEMTVFYGGQFNGIPSWGTWALQPTTEEIVFTGGSISDNFDPITSVVSVTPYIEHTTPESELLQYKFNESDKTATVVQRLVWKQFDEYHGSNVNSYYGDIVIPKKVKGYTVTAIDEGAFIAEESSISSIVIPNTIKKIGSFAFYNCKLLKKLTIPASVESIGEQIIAGSGVQELIVEDSDKPLTAYVAGNSRSPLSDGEQCTKVYVGRNIRLNTTYEEGTDGYGPFTWASALKELTYGPQVSWLNKYECWVADNLQRVTFLTDKVKELPEDAFSSCSNLSSIQLPAKLERIKQNGIFGSQKLKTITLPATLRYLGPQGLDNPALETIYANPTTPPATEDGWMYFDLNVLSNCKLIVPERTLEAYKNAPVWKEFLRIEEDETTGITSVKQTSATSSHYYSIDGRRYENPSLSGIYIYNKKKVFVK